jgi:group I intron endonuclease
MKKISGIYKITSPSGRVYIGQSRNIINRFKTYKRYSCKSQTKLYASLKSHGAHVHIFEIIHQLPADVEQSILDNYEQLYMDQYRECGFEMLNIAPTAGGTMLGFKFTADSKRKMSISQKGKIISEAQRATIAYVNKTRIIKDETRQKISASRIGKPTRPKGYKHTKDAVEKIRESKIGVKRKEFTLETKAKMSLAQTKRHAK